MSGHVVIIGGSLGGLRAAEQLRASGWDGAVTVVGAEPHMPYNRPPLSKELLAAAPDPAPAAHAKVAFRLRESVKDVAWRLGSRVRSVSLADRMVELEDGTGLAYDGLVLATGLRPRRLALPGPQSGRHVIRSLDDALALRRELTPGARVVVVGGGFIGCEVAATAHKLGCSVTVVESLPAPMIRGVGRRLGQAVQQYHEAHGVRFLLGRGVTGLLGGDGEESRVTGILLDDGTAVDADIVVESVGSLPNTEYLHGNGLDLSDGLLCDNLMRVEGCFDVVAVGDVARFPNPRFDGAPRRVEHWSIPMETAKRAAATLTRHLTGRSADDTPFAPLPSFWSDQFDLRLQSFGSPGLGEEVRLLEGRLDSPETLTQGIAAGYYRGSELVGVVLAGLPASAHRSYRQLLTEAPRAA